MDPGRRSNKIAGIVEKSRFFKSAICAGKAEKRMLEDLIQEKHPAGMIMGPAAKSLARGR